jgi:hypothetical protein
VEFRLTVDERPHWSICCADRFSRIGGVTRVQLAEFPHQIAVLTEPDVQRMPARAVIEIVSIAVMAR